MIRVITDEGTEYAGLNGYTLAELVASLERYGVSYRIEAKG